MALINERTTLAREVGHEKLAIGRRYVPDREREREVLLRVAMANAGPPPQADLLSIFRRLIASARALESAERDRLRRDEEGPAEPPGA